MKKETRAFPARFEVRKTAGGPVRISGYAAVFNRLSEDLGGFREKIAPGAFSDALRRSDVRCLINHDPSQIVGRTGVNLTLREDATGLHMTLTAPEKASARFDQLVADVENGLITQQSFGFIMPEGRTGERWETVGGEQVRILTRVAELIDCSPCVFPAYTDTSVAKRHLQNLNTTKNNGAGMAPRKRVTMNYKQQLRDGLQALENLSEADGGRYWRQVGLVDEALGAIEAGVSIADDGLMAVRAWAGQTEGPRYSQGLDYSDGGQRFEIPDQPVYRARSQAAALGQQLLDIRVHSRPDAFSQSVVSESRQRLEQAEKRYLTQIDRTADRQNRAAGSPTLQQGIGSEGGFFIEGESAVELMTAGFNNGVILRLCSERTLNPGSQYIKVVGIDESSRANGYRGGSVQIYTEAELAELELTRPKFTMLQIEPKKLMGGYPVSNELLNNRTALGQEMRQVFGEEFAFKAQDLIIRGTGAGEALGVLNAPCLIAQTAETGQAADTIVTENILKMESRLCSEGRNCAWAINRETKPQLSTLTVDVGTAGEMARLYKTEFYQGTRLATLNGLPCHTIEQCSGLGDQGDILVGDWSHYLTANKGDINEAMSIHVYFLYDQSVFRFVYFFDGQPRFVSAVTPYMGTQTVSPFITLAAR